MAKQKNEPNEEQILNEEEIEVEEVSPEMVDLQEKLKEEEKRTLEMKNMYLRALADYKNLENRMSQERERIRMMIQKQTIERFLPVLDNLDQAEIFTQDPGLKMISSSFRQVLKELGVKEIELLGKEYDPHLAEAIAVVEGEDDDIIVEVTQRAYGWDGEVIRPGKVKVSKKK